MEIKHKVGSCRQKRKKVQLSVMRSNNNGGSNGIEGVIAFGVVAIASLIAAFTIKKGRKHGNKDATNLEVTASCRKEEDGDEGLRSILQDSSSTLHQNSCCTITDHGTSKIGNNKIENCKLIATQSLISDEQTMHCGETDSDSMSGSREIVISDTKQEDIPVTDEIRVVMGETGSSSVMKTIHIETENEAVDADAKQSSEEKSTQQSSFSSDSVSSIEEKCSRKPSWSSSEEEGEEEYSFMQSSISTEEEDEYSPMRSSFSTEEEKERYSPMESSFSTEEETNIEEQSSEETWSSSAESNMEAIWPAEMVGVLSPEPKGTNISQTSHEKETTATIEAYHNLAKTLNKTGTEELIVMNDQKQHSAAAKRQVWVWLGLALLLLLLVDFLFQPHHLANSVISGLSIK